MIEMRRTHTDPQFILGSDQKIEQTHRIRSAGKGDDNVVSCFDQRIQPDRFKKNLLSPTEPHAERLRPLKQRRVKQRIIIFFVF